MEAFLVLVIGALGLAAVWATNKAAKMRDVAQRQP